MNKELKEFNKKLNKIIKTLRSLGIAIFLLGVLIAIVHYAFNKTKSLKENQKAQIEDSGYIINLEDDEIKYQQDIKITLQIKDFVQENNYGILINVNDNNQIIQEKVDKTSDFYIKLTDEGKNQIQIKIYVNDEECYNKIFNVYYIDKYKKQFLDELSNKSVQVHYTDGTWEKYTPSLDLINYCGFKHIKGSILWTSIEKERNKYDFSSYDEWINNTKKLGIGIFACINRVRIWRRK